MPKYIMIDMSWLMRYENMYAPVYDLFQLSNIVEVILSDILDPEEALLDIFYSQLSGIDDDEYMANNLQLWNAIELQFQTLIETLMKDTYEHLATVVPLEPPMYFFYMWQDQYSLLLARQDVLSHTS